MGKRNITDVVAGATICGLGLFVALYSYANYPIGLRGRMGSGTFPLAIGAILALLGLGIFITGLMSEMKHTEIDIKSAASITGAVVIFALTIERFGIIPAIFFMTVAAIPARGWRGWRFACLLATVMSVIATSIFYYGLSMPVRLFDWPY